MENFPLYAELPENEEEELKEEKVEKKEKKKRPSQPVKLANILEKSFNEEKTQEKPAEVPAKSTQESELSAKASSEAIEELEDGFVVTRAELSQENLVKTPKNPEKLTDNEIAGVIDIMDERQAFEVARLIPKEIIDVEALYSSGELDEKGLKILVKDFLKSGDRDRLTSVNLQPKSMGSSSSIGQSEEKQPEPKASKLPRPLSLKQRLAKVLVDPRLNETRAAIKRLSPLQQKVSLGLLSASFIVIFLWLIDRI